VTCQDRLQLDEQLTQLFDQLFDGVYVVDRDRRIIYWNPAAERITGHAADQVVGRLCHENLLQHVTADGQQLCLHGCPLAATLNDGQFREADVYLRHADGHRVPVRVRAVPLFDGGQTPHATAEVFSDISAKQQMRDQIEKLRELAYVDPLTRLPNRRYGQAMLQSKITEVERFGWSMGLMMMDVDHFKQINDTHGHDVGDRVLSVIGQTIKQAVRPCDIVARWGGEEFMGIFPELDATTLATLARRINMLVRRTTVSLQGLGPLEPTISIGATLLGASDKPQQAIKRADALLYQAKANGRDRVELDTAQDAAAA
jgi:diguanylate cyclase (GGDEF)-like protein/PAS domain S-box-containing protein